MDEIDELQLQRYREMTGEQRLRIGLGLFESSVEIARQAVRHRFPNADPEEVEETSTTSNSSRIRNSTTIGNPMTETELLVDCLQRLEQSGIAYMLVGSMAGNYWVVPRSTHNIDFVIEY